MPLKAHPSEFFSTWRLAALALLLTLAGTHLPAPEPPAPPKKTNSPAPARPPLQALGGGVFALGQVRLDKEQRTVTFPATLNQRADAIEYWLVTTYGKTHESLLRTDAEPYHIHLALLLLGARGADTNAFPADHDAPLPGEPVTLEVSWREKDQEQRRRAEELIFNGETKALMTRGDWTFNGSRVVEGQFLAQGDGSIISVKEDEYALINNPRPGRDNDKIWLVHSNGLPPLHTPMQVTIRLRPPPPPP